MTFDKDATEAEAEALTRRCQRLTTYMNSTDYLALSPSQQHTVRAASHAAGDWLGVLRARIAGRDRDADRERRCVSTYGALPPEVVAYVTAPA